jgi:translation initiation factor IF-2
VQLAKEGKATIICFNIKNDQLITSLAEEDGVSLIGSDVIYRLLDEAKECFAKYLPPQPVELVHGRGKVKAVYDITGISDKVAGMEVMEGTLYKDKIKSKNGVQLRSQFRVVRDGKVVSSGILSATDLKHFKENVDQIGRGKDCGLSLGGYSSYEEGDVVECFSVEMRREFI